MIIIIQSTVQWCDPGKCEITPVFPKCNINHSDFQKTKVLSEQVDQHLQNTWIRKIMSLVFGFNHRVGLILLHCDTLITMISTSGTYAFVVFKLHGSKIELAEQWGQLTHSLKKIKKYERMKMLWTLAVILCVQILIYPTARFVDYPK